MGLNSAAPFFQILLFTLFFYVKSPFTFQSWAEIVKKLKNKEEEWVWPRGGRRVLSLEITQSPMNFLFFCFCRRWISSLRRQFFEWLPHFKNAGPFFTILLQAALTFRNKAHIAKIQQGTVLLIRNCQSSQSAISFLRNCSSIWRFLFVRPSDEISNRHSIFALLVEKCKSMLDVRLQTKFLSLSKSTRKKGGGLSIVLTKSFQKGLQTVD